MHDNTYKFREFMFYESQIDEYLVKKEANRTNFLSELKK